MTWLFIDDLTNEAGAFKDKLAEGSQGVAVSVATPAEAKERLLAQNFAPAGVLMDVDLSNAAGERGSGPGIAQDLRVKQRASEISEYPIVRFAARDKVQRNVKGDPASDDLFDLKIQKEELWKDVTSVQQRLIGLERVYSALKAHKTPVDETLSQLLGIGEPQLGRWSHQSFHDRLLSAMQITHVAAAAFMQGFVTPTGLLIDETVLSFRLGVDAARSGARWQDALRQLPFRYQGIGGEHFSRWWARGLDDWWFDATKRDTPLAALTINQRVAGLSALGFDGLVPLAMPNGSAGDRPWRLCALSIEADPPNIIPVDPSEAVRMTPRADMPIWSDPISAALGPALQQKQDFRLNRSDLERLSRKYK